jgi:hypothetical protein
MRILLLGDYSSLHLNLKKALVGYGHQVTLASDGDGFKNLPRDIDINGGFSSNSYLRTFTRIRKELVALKEMRGYDVVQIVNPSVFSRFGPALAEFKFLKKKNGKLFLLAAGDDYFFYKAFREGKYKYCPLAEHLRIDKKSKNSIWESERSRQINEKLVSEIVDGVIPMAYIYFLAYKGKFDGKLYKTVPFPIEVLNPIGFDSIPTGKLVFLHGVQSARIGFKGSHLIDEAMQLIQSKYSDRMEYLRVVDVPFKQYLSFVDKADVVVDQAYSLEPAMNALISMAKGKVVLGGGDEDWMAHFGISACPLVPIVPTVDDIFMKAEQIVLKPSQIPVIQKLAKDYVTQFHNSSEIAKEFLRIWEE